MGRRLGEHHAVLRGVEVWLPFAQVPPSFFVDESDASPSSPQGSSHRSKSVTSIGSSWLGPVSPRPLPWDSQESYDVFHVVQEAIEAKGELLHMQLVEVDGRVVGKVIIPFLLSCFLVPSLIMSVSFDSLGG